MQGGSEAQDTEEQGSLKQLRSQHAWSMESMGLIARVPASIVQSQRACQEPGHREPRMPWCPSQAGLVVLHNKHPLKISTLTQGLSLTGSETDSRGAARCCHPGAQADTQQPLEDLHVTEGDTPGLGASPLEQHLSLSLGSSEQSGPHGPDLFWVWVCALPWAAEGSWCWCGCSLTAQAARLLCFTGSSAERGAEILVSLFNFLLTYIPRRAWILSEQPLTCYKLNTLCVASTQIKRRERQKHQ